MALVYKRSTKNAARRYERSSGMEPNRGLRSNPGVSALTVVNTGRAPNGRFQSGRPSGRGSKKAPKKNPFQWISGRKKHIHESPSYRTLHGAKAWKASHPGGKGRGRARLYATDEYGTVLSKAIPERLLTNPTRRSGMAYNIGALRRAMRANYGAGGVDDPGASSLFAAARAIDTGGRSSTAPRKRRPSARRPRSSRPAESASMGGMTIASRGKRRSSRHRAGTRGKQHDAHIRTHVRHTAGKKAAATRKRNASRRAAAAKKAARTRKRRASGRLPSSRRRASRRGGKRRATKRSATKRRASRRGSKRRASRRRRSRRSSKRGLSRRSYFHGRRVRLTGREYLDKYLTRGFMPTVTRVGRLPLSRSGRPSIMTYPIPRGVGRLSSSRSVRGGTRRGYAVGASYRKGKKGRHKRRMTALAANGRRRSRRGSRRSSRRRGSRRSSRRRASRRRVTRNTMYATANGRRRSRRASRRRGSRRSSRRASRRRVSRNQKYVVMNGRRRSRRGSRRGSRRRGSRRGRRMTRNMLAVSKLRYRGKGSSRVGTPKGRYYQLVEYGPKSGRKYSRAGYPVLVPPHVSQFSYVRKFRLGGAARDAHSRAKSGGYKERKRYSRWRKPPASWLRKSSRKKKMTANRRSSRRSSMRRNQKYVVMNRRRRVRRNTGFASVLGGADLMRDVVTPVIGGTVGFVAARLLSNGLANVPQLRGMLDSGAVDAAGASNTKIAANLLGIAATLGLSTKVGIIRQNRGALVTGMGLALTDRLIQRFSAGTAYGGYLGEYVDQPMSGFGEYVDQPMSGLGTMYAAAGVGEYVEGVDPANMAGVDGLMDVMEAAAGTAMEAAAGFGDTMGSGEADASLAAMYARRQPPFVSTEMPVGGALPINTQSPLDREVKESLVTPEGKGFAGGVFARHLFAGMF